MSAIMLFCKFVKRIWKYIIREKVICQRLYEHSITSENESYHHNYNYKVNYQYIIEWFHLISVNVCMISIYETLFVKVRLAFAITNRYISVYKYFSLLCR